jgi:predicted permease
MTRLPCWTTWLLRLLAPADVVDDVLGDLEEGHARRLRRSGAAKARAITTIEACQMASACVQLRLSRAGIRRGQLVQEHKLAWRMLAKYPGLTIAGGLALAIAIGVGAGWYDLSGTLLRPAIPLPGGDRLVEVEMRNPVASADEGRLLHDLGIWRRDARTLVDLGAWRTLDRSWRVGDARAEPVTVAEISASAFRVARLPPILGRTLIEADEQPGAPAVMVIGHSLWQRQFGGREDVIGRTVLLGNTTTTVVGVMPDGFAFPVNHRLWTPLQFRPQDYGPLEGPPVRIFGRVADGATQAQANAELTVLAERAAKASPETHRYLRPRVLAYGGQSPGDVSLVELAVTHLPIGLVLIVACVNVATLICARTATREAEIATRYALGATRGRIVGQLFIEALVLASAAAVVGLAAAHLALKWGITAFYSGSGEALPFWVDPGLRFSTVLYAAALTVTGAAILGVLPAMKVTGSQIAVQLAMLGAGRSTLRFGGFWTAAMIGQVALTVICLPPAIGISREAVRDRLIRAAYPADRYLTVTLDLTRASSFDAVSTAPAATRLEHTYAELERRLLAEADVRGVTYGDRLPGMSPSVRRADLEVSAGAAPVRIANLWTAAVGPRYFEAFEAPIVAGRDFHAGDRASDSRAVLVNEAFARLHLQGGNPVGRRVRYASLDPAQPNAWLEIVGMVRDIGMTPTDRGEAPYVFTAASPVSVTPLVIGLRVAGDPTALALRVRAIAADLDLGVRLDEVRRLDERVWRVDIPMMVSAGALVFVVGLGLLMSAAGVFSLMAVSVARRTREIALRTALGASRTRLLAGLFGRAAALVGSGVACGNAVLLIAILTSDDTPVTLIWGALLMTSAIMLVVGLVACIEPARRALRIEPIEALKDA